MNPVGPLTFAGVPLAVSGLLAGAIAHVWRGAPTAPHAKSWCGCFALVALGWAVTLATALLAAPAAMIGATTQLCWLGAALLFVHGLRQRARRRDRAPVLVAVWIAIAFAMTLLLEVGAGATDEVRGTVLVLAAIGALVAAIAVGPRAVPGTSAAAVNLDWIVMLLLVLVGGADVGLAWLLAEAPRSIPWLLPTVALWSLPGLVALGLAAMLLINRDLRVALERIARSDPLTGIWNRRGFDEAGPFLLARLRRGGEPVAAVAIADIDAFKSINDRFGHATGDEVLHRFARMLGAARQPGDLLARLGGEEFALLAIGADGTELLRRVEQVRMTMAASAERQDGIMPVTASFGVAELSPRTLTLRDALERADRALYAAKHGGRNRSVLGESPAA